MKIYHFVILFAIFAMSVVVIKDVSFKEKISLQREMQKLTEAAEDAVADATWKLRASDVEFGDETETEVIDTFFYSLYAGLGLMDDISIREALKNRFPVLIIFLNTGYYVYKSNQDMAKSGYERYYTRSELLLYDEKMQNRENGFMAVMKIPAADGTNTWNVDEGRVFTTFVSEGKRYIVDTEGLYHEEECEYIGEISFFLFSKEGCARLGAHPCSRCINN